MKSSTACPFNTVVRYGMYPSFIRKIASAWFVLAGKILDFTTLTRPNVPAIENKISFSFNFERFK